jgi:hypothetical protein
MCRKSTTWDRRLYFPSEGRRAEDFYALKNPTASAGFEPAKLGTKGQHATPRPLKPLKIEVCSCKSSWGITWNDSLALWEGSWGYEVKYTDLSHTELLGPPLNRSKWNSICNLAGLHHARKQSLITQFRPCCVCQHHCFHKTAASYVSQL